MSENNFFIINAEETEFENHTPESSDEYDFPFEFSHTNVWNQSFLPHENNSLIFEELHRELKSITLILNEIKIFLKDTFK